MAASGKNAVVSVTPAGAKGEYAVRVRGRGYAGCTIRAKGMAAARRVLADWIFNELEGRELSDEP